MRPLRYLLRLIFALEALGFLSLAFFTLPQSKLVAVTQRLHLGPLDYGTVLVYHFAGSPRGGHRRLAAGARRSLGRWSLLAASIFNLLLFPVWIAGGHRRHLLFRRAIPPVEPKINAKHLPIAGDGTSKWSGTIFIMAQLVWGVFVLSSIRRWTACRGMPQIQSEALFWITLVGAVYGSVLFHELGHSGFGRYRPVPA